MFFNWFSFRNIEEILAEKGEKIKKGISIAADETNGANSNVEIIEEEETRLIN